MVNSNTENKWHITPDGPKKCSANIKPCKYNSSGHYSILKEAEENFQQSMNNHSLAGIKKAKESKNFHIDLSPESKWVIHTLNDAGIKPLIVGGTVRDHLMGIGNLSKDIDLELYGSRPNGDSLNFKDVSKLFKKHRSGSGMKVSLDEAGASFSVLKIRVNDEDFDVALPRTESSTGDHHRDYRVDHDTRISFDEAAMRRDFTINAIGYNPITGELIDPHNGYNDINQGILRHVSEAFSDDPLRCLRAVNFASRFGYTLDPKTQELCNKLAPKYSTIAKERVREELNKVFTRGKYCDNALKMLHDIGWSVQMKEFSDVNVDELYHYGKLLNKTTPGLSRKAVLSYQMIKDGHHNPLLLIEDTQSKRAIVNNALSFLSASNNLNDSDSRAHYTASYRKLMNENNTFIRRNELRNMMTALNISTYSLDHLPEVPDKQIVTGSSLVERGYKPGVNMGKVITRAQYLQDSGVSNDYDELLNMSLRDNDFSLEKD